MADVKKIATRDSYGNALKELGEQVRTSSFLTQTWPAPPRPEPLKRLSPTVTSTVVSLKLT